MNHILNLKHGPAIIKFFDLIFEPGLTQIEKVALVNQMLEKTGLSLARLDNDIEQGIKNCYTIEQQMQHVAKIIQHYRDGDK